MGIISKMRKQTCTYWARLGTDGSGQPRFADPIDIKCRWEDETVEFLDQEGAKQISNAIVYVDREVTLGGVLRLGAVADIGTSLSPNQHRDAYHIRKLGKLPNLRNTETLLTAYV